MAVAIPEIPEQITWRCPRCGRILAKVCLKPGSSVEVKCGCNWKGTYQEPD